MLDLARNGYTEQEVINQLHGKNGSRGLVKIRYDLLNRQDVKLGELAVQSGRVSMNSLAEIKRTASFELTEQEAQDVDWLNDRIRPVFCLKMPEIRKTYKAWGKIDASFTRSSIAYLSDGTPVPANVPRFEQGKFGKAVMVEEGTTNLYPYPDFSSGIHIYSGLSAEVIDDSQAKTGKALRVICTDSEINQAARVGTSSFTPGASGTFSVYIKGIGDSIGYIPRVYFGAGGSGWIYSDIPLSDEYQRYVFNDVVTSGEVKIGLLGGGWILNSGIEICDPQFEAKPYPTSFVDGTRAAETLTIPTEGMLNQDNFTIEGYFIPLVNSNIVGTWARFLGFTGVPLTGFYINGGVVRFAWNNKEVINTDLSLVVGDILFYALSKSGNTITLHVSKNSGALSKFIGVTDGSTLNITTIALGSSGTDSYFYYNGKHDDLRISNRARSDEEILAAYQSGQPAPVDEWTTAKFDFDNRLTGEYFTIVNDSKPVQWIEWPLGVFLLSSPTRRDENKQIKRSIEAYDSSLILKEDKFTDRYLIAAGTKYTTAIIDILNNAGIWKINIIDHPGTLAVDREFEIGTTKLYAVNELLAAINYTSLWVDENGYFVAQPYVLPSDRDPEYEYRTGDLSIIHPGATEELDLFSVPNKWVRYVSNPDRAVILRSEYVNDLSTSPTSTINRGRTIVDIEAVDDIADQATLDEYTKRIAYNASQVYGKFEFSTAPMPHHSYYNCLFVEHTGFGIAHKYIESSWSMDLHANGVMTHSCRRVINI